jgi:ATP-dependent DNA helicase RecQ
MYHQALFLTDAARPLLKGTQTLELKPFSTEKKVANARNAWLKTERQEQLWQTLRVWRKKMADQHNTPAYIIFGDLTLRALVEKQPTTLAELAKIEGLGEKKRHQYGAELCQLILNNVQQNNTNAFVLP